MVQPAAKAAMPTTTNDTMPAILERMAILLERAIDWFSRPLLSPRQRPVSTHQLQCRPDRPVAGQSCGSSVHCSAGRRRTRQPSFDEPLVQRRLQTAERDAERLFTSGKQRLLIGLLLGQKLQGQRIGRGRRNMTDCETGWHERRRRGGGFK